MNSKSQISQKNSKNCELGNHFFSHVPKLQNWAFCIEHFETMRKLCLFTKFRHQQIRWNSGILCSGIFQVFRNFSSTAVLLKINTHRFFGCSNMRSLISSSLSETVHHPLNKTFLEPPPKVAPPSFSCRLLPSSLEIQTLSYLIFKKITVFSQKEIYNCWLNLIPRNTSILTHLLTH